MSRALSMSLKFITFLVFVLLTPLILNKRKKQTKTTIQRKNIPTCEYYQFRLAAPIHILFVVVICSFADFFKCKHNSLSLYVDYICRFVFPSYLLVLLLLLYRFCFCDFVNCGYYCALLL